LKCSTCCSTGSGRRLAKHVAGKDQHRQAVGHGSPGGGHHVGRARADGGQRHHDLPSPLGLGEADRGERHRLLVLTAPGGELILDGFQRLGKAGDVAMSEDGKDAREQRHGLAVDFGFLVDEIADQGLGHGQAHRLHVSSRRVSNAFVLSSQ
jgi:hypothetical protein